MRRSCPFPLKRVEIQKDTRREFPEQRIWPFPGRPWGWRKREGCCLRAGMPPSLMSAICACKHLVWWRHPVLPCSYLQHGLSVVWGLQWLRKNTQESSEWLQCSYLGNRLETDDSSCPLLPGKITLTASPTVCRGRQCVTILNGLCEDDITQDLVGRRFFFTPRLKLRRQRGDMTPYSGSLRRWWTELTSCGWPGRHHQVLTKYHRTVVKTRDIFHRPREHTDWSRPRCWSGGLLWKSFIL